MTKALAGLLPSPLLKLVLRSSSVPGPPSLKFSLCLGMVVSSTSPEGFLMAR